jgi:CheY-like chemotaxis protein
MIVEDNPDDVLLIGMALIRCGLAKNMVKVPSGDQAIKYFRGEGCYADREAFPIPSLVMLDIKMPRVDGFEVLQWIRSHPEWRAIPVIVLTTSCYASDIERAYNLGANSFLTKANDFNKFRQDIRDMASFWLGHVSLPKTGPFVPIPETVPGGVTELHGPLRSANLLANSAMERLAETPSASERPQATDKVSNPSPL